MRFAIHSAYSGDEVETFLEQLPMMFDGEGEMLYDKRNQVKRFVLPSGRPVIVKRFKKPILIQRIIYEFFRKTKLIHAFPPLISLAKSKTLSPPFQTDMPFDQTIRLPLTLLIIPN